MSTFALQRFIDTHPPDTNRQPVSNERLEAWRGYVPDSLLDLWSLCGFGFFGTSQLCLLNPDEWIPILDRWVTSRSGASGRVPILMSPFGDLYYYRRFSAEEDISVIYIDTCEAAVISWNLEDFFNGTLCNSIQLRNLMPAQLGRIQARYGLLNPGQVYQMVPPINGQPISVEKAPALWVHENRLNNIRND